MTVKTALTCSVCLCEHTEDLEDVIETDKDSGKPALHQSVEITVEPRAQRKWIK